ncbi:MAG: AAA family ATPase [Spirochaetes bacterium]|nr:AAA family ATPase [Spirochaetota bacterium]
MFLKDFKVYGFKTFGKKIEIDFQKGITAIVGPNGAGKTNLIESLNWVLGETKMSDLRVKTADQLIFHGSPNLKPLGLAEVSLTMINTENLLPIDFSEVNLTRRVSKDGISEYYINKSKCTLKDINNLFIDTGIGKSAYSIMRQGEIDRLLRKKPVERREIFEEAAGILKYRNRRKETERDLEKAEANLKQVRPTLIEVERQYNSKKKQAERAEKYRELIDKKTSLEVDIHLIKLFDLKKKFSDKTENQKIINDKKIKILEKLQNIEKEIDDSIQQSRDLQKTQNGMQTDIIQNEGHVASIKQRTAMLEDNKQNLLVSISSWENSLNQNNVKIANIESRVKEMNEEKINHDKMVSELRDNLEKYEKDIESISKILSDDAKNIKTHQTKISDIHNVLVTKRTDLEQVINRLVEAIDKRKAELKGSIEVKQDLKTSISSSMDELILFLANRKDMIGDLLQLDFLDNSDPEKIKAALQGFKDGLEKRLASAEELQEKFKKLDNLIAGFDEIIFAREGIHAQKEDLDKMIDMLNKEEISHRERILFLETDIENQKHKTDTIKQMMHETQTSVLLLREKQKSLEDSIETQERFKKDIHNQVAFLKRDIVEAKKNIEAIQSDIKNANKEHEIKLFRQNKLKEDLTKINKDLSSITSTSSNNEKSARQLKDSLESVHDKIDDNSRVVTTLEVEIKNIYDNFYENYSIDLKKHEENITDKKFDNAELRTDLKKVNEEIKGLGQINLLAVDEYKELEERYKLLNEQISDIEKSKKNLITIIKEINKNSEEVFHDTFNRIKVNFHKIFRRLFDGGRAELNLTDPENLLESGIDILVQPPAKSLQTVDSLSGGESAMTAIALLFSIFMVKPSPFCLLDEIDAALDGPNIGRFRKLIDEFKDTTQFLMISHNINTLKSADAIYGISMEEDGVSTAISIDINEIENQKKKYKLK